MLHGIRCSLGQSRKLRNEYDEISFKIKKENTGKYV
jgi:hypothetical protein